MLIADVPEADLNQLFRGTIVKHREYGWVFVSEIRERDAFFITLDGKKETPHAVFTDENFSLVPPKLGYYNIAGSALYISRMPRRVMKAAASFDTFKYSGIPNRKMGYSVSDLQYAMMDMKFSLYDVFEGVYPSLQEAIEKCKEKTVAAVAYDPQFAVDYCGNIYYRGNTRVGMVVDGAVVFNEGYKQLAYSGGDYGQALQAAKKAARERIGRAGN